MLRQFLVALALVTGLAALAEPAQAARFASDIATTSVAEQGQACASANSGLIAAGLRSDVRQSYIDKTRPRPAAKVIVPTVQLQADRARE